MIGLERLATVQDHFVAILLGQVGIFRLLEHRTQLLSALTHPTTTTTQAATANRPAANLEDFTSTPLHRMVIRNDQFHPSECFPPHHRQLRAAFITYRQTVETPHQLHYLPIRFTTEADETEQW